MKFKKTIPIAISIMTASLLAPIIVSCNSGEVMKNEATIEVNSTNGSVKLSVDGEELKDEKPKIEVGKTLKVEVTPNENYIVKSIKLGSDEVKSNNEAEFVIKASGNIVLEVLYESCVDCAKITVENTEHGLVTIENNNIDLNNVALGTEIKLKVTPQSQYELSTLTVNDIDIKDSLTFNVTEKITYIIKASFVKIVEQTTLATLEVQNINSTTNAPIQLTTQNFKTQNVELISVSSDNCYTENGLVRVATGKNPGSINFEFDRTYSIVGIKIYGETYHDDQTKVEVDIGSEKYVADFENITNIELSKKVEATSFSISSDKSNRFILSKIELEIKEGTGGTVDPTPDPEPDPDPEQKEASITVNKTGEGTVELDKMNGFEGDVIKATIKPASNFYISTIKFNGEYTYLDSGSNYVSLTLIAGTNTLEVVFKEKGSESESSGFDHLYDNNLIKPTRGSQGSYDSYYEPIRGLKGKALKEGLNKIIKGHKTFGYKSLNETMKVTDADPFNPNNIIFTYEGSLSKNNEYNKEHTWAKSVGDFGTSTGPGTDMHHLRPSHINLNSTRSNFDFAEVTGGKDCGTAYKRSRPTMKGNLVGGSKFEPKDEFKGDVARMIFYMATRYEGDDGYLDLEVGGSKGTLSGIDTNKYYTFGTGKGMHGCFNDLYKWATTDIDPVSDFEVNRNNLIDEKYQHNRNPFIDHPEFVIMIYDKNYDGAGALNDK